jgi:hypothetical protein
VLLSAHASANATRGGKGELCARITQIPRAHRRSQVACARCRAFMRVARGRERNTG